MNTPPAPQEGTPERRIPPEDAMEQLPDFSDGLPTSAKAEINVAFLPDTGELKAKGKAAVRVPGVLAMGVGSPAVTLVLGTYADMGPNWLGPLIILELGLAGWLARRGSKK